MKLELVDKIFETLETNNQNPKTELNYTNNFTLLIAVILSARATDSSVNKATKNLFENFNAPEGFLKLGEEKLREYIKTIGLFKSKAKNIIALCEILVRDYFSEIPKNFGELIKLPGVGEKTAKVVLNCAFGERVIPVDTHVMRVSRRLGLASSKNPESISRELENIIPDKWKDRAHHWLVLHGRYVCKARKPLCKQCILVNYCDYAYAQPKRNNN